jgi:hypothetical protein
MLYSKSVFNNKDFNNKDFKKLLLILPHAKNFSKRATDARISYT